MKTTTNCLLLILCVFVIACHVADKKAGQENKDVEVAVESVGNKTELTVQSMLDRCIEAHGGMDNWNSFQAMSYQLSNNGTDVFQLTNLHDRRAYLKSAQYEVGYDGHVAWALPDANELPGKSAAFYYNLDFYFVGIPFLLKDPGVLSSYIGKRQVNGIDYEVIKIGFESEIGLTPNDVYFLYLNPESMVLELLTYSISYFDQENSTVSSAKRYSGWHEVQGILMPEKMENFEWNEGQIGKSKQHIRIFSEYKFLKELPNDTIFEVPEEAEIESLAQAPSSPS